MALQWRHRPFEKVWKETVVRGRPGEILGRDQRKRAGNRLLQAEVPPVAQERDTAVARRNLLDDRRAAVRRAVVDHDDLVGRTALATDGAQGFGQVASVI